MNRNTRQTLCKHYDAYDNKTIVGYTGLKGKKGSINYFVPILIPPNANGLNSLNVSEKLGIQIIVFHLVNFEYEPNMCI